MNKKSKPRIVAYSQHLPPHPNAGSPRGYSFCREIAKWTECIVLAPTRDVSQIENVAAIRLKSGQVDNSKSLPKRTLGEIKNAIDAILGLEGKGHPDAVLISLPFFMSALFLALWCCLRKYRYVLDVGNIYPDVYVHRGVLRRASIAYRVIDKLSNHAYRHPLMNFAATLGRKRQLDVRTDSKLKYHLIHNGLSENLTRHYYRKLDRFTVVFHGIMSHFQDTEALVYLAQRLREHDIDFVVIGYSPKEHLIVSCTSSSLTFLCKLPHDETLTPVGSCYLGVSSRSNDEISKDVFPVKVWEYMRLGIPVLVTPKSEVGRFPERTGCGVQFDPTGHHQLIAEIVRILRDPSILQGYVDATSEISNGYTR